MKTAIILILIVIPIAVNAAEWGGSYASKGDPYHIHDNNNYWLTVYDEMYEGGRGNDGPSGEYPGGSDNDYLYFSWGVIGLRSSDEYHVISGKYEDEGEFVPVGTFYSTDSEWPGGFTQYGDYDTSTLCNDDNAGELGPIGILVRRQSWSFTSSTLDDCVGFKYIVHNDGNEYFSELYIVHRVDFDIGPISDDDLVGCDVGRELAYMYDSGSTPGYMGVTCGSDANLGTGFYACNAIEERFDDVTLFGDLQTYGWIPKTTPYDYRFYYVIKMNSYDLDPGETVTVGFYQVAGMTLAELQANADAARASYVVDDPPLGIENIKSASLGEIKAMFK